MISTQEILCRNKVAVDIELKDILSERTGILYDMINYQFGWSKEEHATGFVQEHDRLRSNLCIAVCEAICGNFKKSISGAAALELIHNFSLVHDDVQEGRPGEESAPTLWWRWGPAQAINAGDGLHTLGRLALLRLNKQSINPAVTMQAISIVDTASLRFCEGQHTSLEFQERLDITIDGYLNMAKQKTGALISAATQLGALLGGANGDVVNKFAAYGDKIGLVYQLRSDILSLWEPDRASGREDLVTKKKSFPVVFVFANGDFKLKRELGSIYSNRILSVDHVASIQKIAESAGAKEASHKIMHTLEKEALEILKGINLEPKDLEGFQNIVDLVLGENGDLQG